MIGDLVGQYRARPALRSGKYKEQVRRAIEAGLRWSRKRALDITPEKCRDMHQKLAKRAPHFVAAT